MRPYCVLFNYCQLTDSRRGGGVVLHPVAAGEPPFSNQEFQANGHTDGLGQPQCDIKQNNKKSLIWEAYS